MIERLSLIVNDVVLRLGTLDLKREEGQGVTEYGLAIGFVAVVVAGLLVTFKTPLTNFFSAIGTDLAGLPANL